MREHRVSSKPLAVLASWRLILPSHLRRREAARAADAAARARRLAAALPAAVALLRGHFGVTDVTPFGSLAKGTGDTASDVDLAVRGLATEHYFPALAELMAVFNGPLDLVRLEEAPASRRERIAAEGRAL